MTDAEQRMRVLGIAADINRVLKAHTDSLPGVDGDWIAFMGAFVAVGFETLRAMRVGGCEPTIDDLAQAMAAAPFDACAELVLDQVGDAWADL